MDPTMLLLLGVMSLDCQQTHHFARYDVPEENPIFGSHHPGSASINRACGLAAAGIVGANVYLPADTARKFNLVGLGVEVGVTLNNERILRRSAHDADRQPQVRVQIRARF